MNPTAQRIRELLDRIHEEHPEVHALYESIDDDGRPILVAAVQTPADTHPVVLSRLTDTRNGEHNLPVHFHHSPPAETLLLPANSPHAKPAAATLAHQRCWDEPIPGGVQVQPHGANWLGTGGVLCRSDAGEAAPPRYVLLSNAHVLVTYGLSSDQPRRPTTLATRLQQATPIHQPTTARPAMARLLDHQVLDPTGANYIDAAIADTQVGDYHSMARQILGAEMPTCDHPANATVGLTVARSGRTLGYRQGKCVGVKAAVRVQYGAHTLTFVDQDIFADPGGASISQPGDSGSLIFTPELVAPVALLFAGSNRLTIGNPIRYVAERFQLSFVFV